jgi:hypothetical protein
MTEPHIQLLDDLGAEFARVAAERERAPRRSRLRSLTATPARALAVAVSALVVLGGGTYAVQPTRAAIEDLTSTFAGWLAEDESDAPGRALRPEDDAPEWVREEGGRVIVEKAGVELYVTRSETENGTYLSFVLEGSVAVGNTIEGWRDTFQNRSVMVLGPGLDRLQDVLDEQGRFPLLGLAARSVERVELHYEQGPPVVETGVDGGFILLTDAWRQPRELIAYDAAGRELERVSLAYLDTRDLCDKEPTCPSS